MTAVFTPKQKINEDVDRSPPVGLGLNLNPFQTKLLGYFIFRPTLSMVCVTLRHKAINAFDQET